MARRGPSTRTPNLPPSDTTHLTNSPPQNQLPPKDIVKVSFILEPLANALPSISSDGYIPFSLPFETAALANAALSNNRLNANRMLRARKILGYVAERIEPPPSKEEVEARVLRPEEYLELWCNGQVGSFPLFSG